MTYQEIKQNLEIQLEQPSFDTESRNESIVTSSSSPERKNQNREDAFGDGFLEITRAKTSEKNIKKPKLNKSDKTDISVNEIAEEGNRFVNLPIADRKQCSSRLWKSETRFPLLKNVAQKMLCTPASSVYSERVFSEHGNIFENKRTWLLPKRRQNAAISTSQCKKMDLCKRVTTRMEDQMSYDLNVDKSLSTENFDPIIKDDPSGEDFVFEENLLKVDIEVKEGTLNENSLAKIQPLNDSQSLTADQNFNEYQLLPENQHSIVGQFLTESLSLTDNVKVKEEPFVEVINFKDNQEQPDFITHETFCKPVEPKDQIMENYYSSPIQTGDLLYQDVRSIGNINPYSTQKDERFSCQLCDFRSHWNSSLKVHMLTHSTKKILKCPECDYECNRKDRLTIHILKHSTIKLFKCSKCDYECNRSCHLKRHMLKHNNAHKCTECEYEFILRTDLSAHMLNVHSISKPYKCSECEYECYRNYDLKTHMLCHSDVKLFKCTVCDYECRRKTHLNAHMVTHSNVKLFKCSECHYESYRNGDLKRHMLKHSNIKLFKCPQCDYQCNRKNYLKAHMLDHLCNKIFKCPECNFECFQKKELKSHMVRHTNAKIYECPECKYESYRNCDLKRHMLKHSSVKLFKCSDCNYECNRKTQLKLHMKRHNKPKDKEYTTELPEGVTIKREVD